MSEDRKEQHGSPDSNHRVAGTLAGVAVGAGAGGLLGLFFSPLKSKLFLLALAGTLAGAFLVVRGHVQEGAAVPEWSPWAMRVGVSFVAAFVFAYLVRRAVKWALLIGGALIAGAVVLNKLGLGITKDQLASLEGHVRSGAEAIQHTADSAWESIKPHLPSSGAAGVGMWRGLRHQSAKA